jgi:hypothetical protein
LSLSRCGMSNHRSESSDSDESHFDNESNGDAPSSSYVFKKRYDDEPKIVSNYDVEVQLKNGAQEEIRLV